MKGIRMKTKARKKKRKVRANVTIVKDVVFASTAKRLITELSHQNVAALDKIDRLKEQVESSNKRIELLNEILQIYNNAVRESVI